MDKRPIRRKYRDNPYTLNYIKQKNIYIVSFKDLKGNINNIEVNKAIYDAFDQFELNDLKEINEYDRHIEHSEIYENNLYSRSKNKPSSLEDDFIKKTTFEELKIAIEKLPKIQRRRIKKYYFENKNEYQIAKEEHSTQPSVHIIISRAIENLKKMLKN